MRWKTVEDEDAAQAALFPEDLVVDRHVGTGEFRGLEFLHVRAKRIINEVPGGARHLPFRWTINAYRGCSHACIYCASPDTPVLMADGRHRRIADVRVGDEIYGVERVGQYTRFVATTVLNHWSTVKPAYRVVLADGTELIASGEHRFLSNRGWKHVTGAGHGPDCRPHLVMEDALIGTGRFVEQPKHDDEYLRGYKAGAHGSIERDWPDDPGEQWHKGFLAGVFDANGAHERGVLRITNRDPQVLAAAAVALARFGFASTSERSATRLKGGQSEHLRFFHLTDPAITRKRTLLGQAIKNKADLRVVSVEALGIEIPMYDITTGTGNFIANGVVSHNCFARPTHDYLGLNIGDDFDRKIVVKVNAVERLRAELRASRWAGDAIAMGTNTDPYQRCEGKYHLTQGIIKVLAEHRNPFSILTKSTLILRDLELLRQAASRTNVHLSFSIGTLDEATWKATEPGTPHPRQRLEAVRKIAQAGIRCSVLVAPVIPGMSDAPEQVEEVVQACLDAGATNASPIALHLRPGVRDHFMGWLRTNRADLVPMYEQLYPANGRGYLPKSRGRATPPRKNEPVPNTSASQPSPASKDASSSGS